MLTGTSAAPAPAPVKCSEDASLSEVSKLFGSQVEMFQNSNAMPDLFAGGDMNFQASLETKELLVSFSQKTT